MSETQTLSEDPRDEFINVSVWHGSLDRAQEILALYPEVASSDIHTAALRGDHEAVARILAEDPTRATAKGGPRSWDPLTHLCFSKFLRLDNARTEGFLKAATAYNGSLDAIDTAIALGAESSAPNVGLNPNATALHNAVCSGSLAAVRKLIEAGESVHVKDGPYKHTPLQWAEYFVRESNAGKIEYFRRRTQAQAVRRNRQLPSQQGCLMRVGWLCRGHMR